MHLIVVGDHQRKKRYNGETNGICKSTAIPRVIFRFKQSYVPLLSILHQSFVGQGDVLRTLVRALADEPPHGDKDGQTTGHQTGVVHRGSLGGQSVGEAEDDDEGDDVDAGQNVDDVSDLVVHEEEAGNEGGAASENVGKDGHEVGKTGQLHEASDESAESGS